MALGLAAAPAWAAGDKPRISSPATIVVEPGGASRLAIEVEPMTAVPARSFVRVRGLPAEAKLSDGHPIAPGSWAVPLAALEGLTIASHTSPKGASDLRIALVAVDGAVLAETRVTFLIAAAGLLAPPATASAIVAKPAPATVSPPTVQAAPQPPAAAAVSPPAPPPPPAATPPTPEERERALRLKGRGDEALAAGDIATARLFYKRAADSGLAEAAMALAATYDPTQLSKRAVQGPQPDPAAAREWYERARVLGAEGAAEALARLLKR